MFHLKIQLKFKRIILISSQMNLILTKKIGNKIKKAKIMKKMIIIKKMTFKIMKVYKKKNQNLMKITSFLKKMRF